MSMNIIPQKTVSKLTQTFTIKNFPLPYSNGLRRSLHADVATLCFDKAYFVEYSGDLPEEFIAHRFGLLPLHVEESVLNQISPFYICPNLTSQDHGPTCTVCTVCAHIDVFAGETPFMVTDRDIVFERSDISVFSVYYSTPPVPLILIGARQHFKCNLFAYKAPGRVHAKFSPVSAVTLQPKQVVRIDRIAHLVQNDAEAVRRLQEICPRGVFVASGGSLKLIKAEQCVFCDACVRTAIRGIDNPVSVEPDYSEMQMTVESAGGMSCSEIVRQGLLSLMNGCEQVASGIEIYDMNADAVEDGVDTLY